MKQENRGVIVVTGASSGIGAVYADRLAARGYDLILVARRRERLATLADRLRSAYGCDAQAVAADLSSDDGVAQIEALIDRTADFAGIVNAAGLGALGLSASVDPSAVDTMIRVNVLALTRLSLAAARRCGAAGHGMIVNIGSIVTLMPVPGAGGYSGSKAYVLNFTRSLHAELEPRGVAIQAVMPGPVRTEFFGDTAAPFPDALFMSPETLVDTALHALDHEESVCFPTLHDLGVWQQFDGARGQLLRAVTRDGQPAARYSAI
ncbi:SDR family NAD(P)-dependent oxidoreductase [Burkholderia lata]|uniref:AraC family transcriptional regulator n=1 Tax=Burkholderia lata (strain ATCC 17760 / DSM 23089 / LMG 22485 / NCIMB 9086 / R18194 / 383) TaxID=482957 RepID=A0A6P2NVP0_BURL3|nr:SDR family oxidoreductase [Burkholderia lata]VWB49635.1 AraC family transcriptional regulator [Burkholderia lata]VWB98812.1 AraC family transcriptional regulator [Burkholderia lata]